jgi:hypothetical protein
VDRGKLPVDLKNSPNPAQATSAAKPQLESNIRERSGVAMAFGEQAKPPEVSKSPSFQVQARASKFHGLASREERKGNRA